MEQEGPLKGEPGGTKSRQWKNAEPNTLLNCRRFLAFCMWTPKLRPPCGSRQARHRWAIDYDTFRHCLNACHIRSQWLTTLALVGGGHSTRTLVQPSKPSGHGTQVNPHQHRLKWVAQLPQNRTIGSEPWPSDLDIAYLSPMLFGSVSQE